MPVRFRPRAPSISIGFALILQLPMENTPIPVNEREILQLREMINALRDELEKAQIERESSIQEVRQGYSSEITLLKDTIFALNTALSQKDIERTQALQALTQQTENAKKEHIGMINELRDELERERQRRDQLIQEKTLSLTQQVNELMQTADVLRQKMETKK